VITTSPEIASTRAPPGKTICISMIVCSFGYDALEHSCSRLDATTRQTMHQTPLESLRH
jgi:hypothetical protein